MDSFKEQILKKNVTQRDKMSKLCIMIASVALAFCFIFLMFMSPRLAVICIFLACMSVYGGYYLSQNLDIEYEYIFTNGDLDVDKIIAQRRRKRLISIHVNDVTGAGIADENYNEGDRTLVFAAACDSEKTDYYLETKHKSYGQVSIIFTPDDEMLRLIKTHLPRNIRNSITVPDKPEEEE
ncbi:MAG: hypothetical protein IJ737_02690 [Ruminococcus sp.]|nr:hypothetical protein [Ruminococcus sp.]